ncbi:unnamed protein product [Gordionus sp. m RMFG-2023]
MINVCKKLNSPYRSHIIAFWFKSLNCINVKNYSKRPIDLSSIIKPITIEAKKNPDDINIGFEITQNNIKKEELIKALNAFYRLSEIKSLAEEQGLDQRLFSQGFLSFRRFCLESDALPVEFHIVMSDILTNAGHVSDIFPYFLKHAKQMFPHIECMDDLKKISDLTDPLNWYSEARAHTRKIIYHAGPTNSGKTYQALQRFINAKSGIYCGPLKMLANEVYNKTNENNTNCDLVTGEERKLARSDGIPSNHVSCTVEMTKLSPETSLLSESTKGNHYEVAIIDEIQMIKDPVRGWAWSRALLGLVADEIHLCGESSAIQIVKDILNPIGENVEIRKYKRLTPLTILDKPLGSFDNVKDGDCIVCFSKNDIYMISQKIEARGKSCAVIYGGLPPGTKLEQAKRFNDPDDPCKIMVATDAIGMGINLNIKRIIFYSLLKPSLNETTGEREMERLSVSQALQISGRAGRFGMSQNSEDNEIGGQVTTFGSQDLFTLKSLLRNGEASIEPIEVAGLHPTAEQIELFSYHLPKASLSNLLDIFTAICTVDNSKYFMCNLEDFKFLADAAQHIPLPLKVRYVFCCAPISKKQTFVCAMFIKFARQFSRGQPLTFEWLCHQLNDWPFSPPLTITDLVHLEGVFDVLDMYLWLSYRFVDMFPDVAMIRDMQLELDAIIKIGVTNLTKLLCNSNGPSNVLSYDPDIPTQYKTSKSQRSLTNNSNYSNDSEAINDKARTLDDNIAYESDANSPVTTTRKFVKGFHKKRETNGLETKLSNHETNDMSSPTKKRYGNKGNNQTINYGPRSRLTDQLLERGLLTPKMLRELKNEWQRSKKNEDTISANDKNLNRDVQYITYSSKRDSRSEMNETNSNRREDPQNRENNEQDDKNKDNLYNT